MTPYLAPTVEEIIELALYIVYGPIVPSRAIVTDVETRKGTGDGVGNPSFRDTFCVTVILTGVAILLRIYMRISKQGTVIFSSANLQQPIHIICHCSHNSGEFEP